MAFLLAGDALLADEPDLLARHVVHAFIADPLRRPVSDAHVDGGEVCFQRPFRSLGQVSIRQFALASTSSAPTERALAHAARGGDRVRRRGRRVRRRMGRPSGDGGCRPPRGRAARAQGLTKRRAHAIAGVSEDGCEANVGADQSIQFGKSNLRLGPRRATFGGPAGALQPSLISGPALQQKQPQARHRRGFAARERQRRQGLAIDDPAQSRRALRRDAKRIPPSAQRCCDRPVQSAGRHGEGASAASLCARTGPRDVAG